MRRIVSPLILLLLAGCASPSAPTTHTASCEPFDIPPATLGSQFIYNATGPYWDLLHGATAVDWRFAGSTDDRNGRAILPAGSTVRVAIAGTDKAMADTAGIFYPATQVTTWLGKPSALHQLPILDEWIAADGATVAVGYRNVLKLDDGTALTSLRLDPNGGPPLLGATLVRTASTASLNLNEWQTVATTNNTFNVEMTTSFEADDKECVLRAMFTYHHPTYGRNVVTQTYDGKASLPRTYDVAFGDTGERFSMTLVHVMNGMGRPVADWNATRAPARTLPLQMAEEGLMSHTAGIFTTPWSEAMSRIKADAAVAGWLTRHPGAELSSVVRANGTESVRDEWTVIWNDAASATSFQATLTRRRPLFPGLEDTFAVASTTGNARDAPFYPQGDRPSLQALVDIYQRQTGNNVEVLQCNLELGTCGVGSHDDTGFPRAGNEGAGASFISPGLSVDVATGRLYQFQMHGDAALGPPVGA